MAPQTRPNVPKSIGKDEFANLGEGDREQVMQHVHRGMMDYATYKLRWQFGRALAAGHPVEKLLGLVTDVDEPVVLPEAREAIKSTGASVICEVVDLETLLGFLDGLKGKLYDAGKHEILDPALPGFEVLAKNASEFTRRIDYSGWIATIRANPGRELPDGTLEAWVMVHAMARATGFCAQIGTRAELVALAAGPMPVPRDAVGRDPNAPVPTREQPVWKIARQALSPIPGIQELRVCEADGAAKLFVLLSTHDVKRDEQIALRLVPAGVPYQLVPKGSHDLAPPGERID